MDEDTPSDFSAAGIDRLFRLMVYGLSAVLLLGTTWLVWSIAQWLGPLFNALLFLILAWGVTYAACTFIRQHVSWKPALNWADTFMKLVNLPLTYGRRAYRRIPRPRFRTAAMSRSVHPPQPKPTTDTTSRLRRVAGSRRRNTTL